MNTGILSLPNEVLLSVADHLCLGDLYECNRVCRPWHHIFRQALYRSIDIHDTSSADSLVTSSIPLYAIRHLYLANQVNVNSASMSTFPWSRLQSLHTTQLVLESIPIQHTCLSNLTLSNVQFDTLAPYFTHMRRLEKLSLNMTGNLLISDVDHIQQACPYLVTLELQGDVLSSSNLIRHISSSETQTRLASRLTNLAIRFKSADYDAAVPWFTYITHAFQSLHHLTLEGQSVMVDLAEQQQLPMGQQVDAAFVACCGVTRLPLKSLRLRYLGYLLCPDLYLVLVYRVPNVDLQGIELKLCKEGWLERMLASMNSAVQNLSVTMVYPRALCTSPILRSCQSLRELTIGRTSGFCSSRGHWQLPLDDILARVPSLDSLTLCQVTLTDADHNENSNTGLYGLHHRLRRLVLKSVVISNHVFQRVAQLCPNMDWLEMNQCKWMDSRQQQQGQIPAPGRIHLPQHHLRMVDISQSGHLYNLEGYQLLELNGRQWVKSISKDDQSREIKTWQQLREAHKIQRRCELVNPCTVTNLEIKHHGHLELSCASVQHLYFNGSRVPIPLL
ncbi:hypothetical protein K492DRAFT_192666 [Lichtheimia hyalospora FSU 10163]|nr:hypothetical protein K492DRAFT_192666 [Lichtheimia hyalospora FSU 10163]